MKCGPLLHMAGISLVQKNHILYYFDQSFTSCITKPHELNQFGFHHASQRPVNIFKSGIVGVKKNLGALCQFYKQRKGGKDIIFVVMFVLKVFA